MKPLFATLALLAFVAALVWHFLGRYDLAGWFAVGGAGWLLALLVRG